LRRFWEGRVKKESKASAESIIPPNKLQDKFWERTKNTIEL